MPNPPRHYASFVLRLWTSVDDQAPLPHVLLEQIPSGERHSFTEWEGLVAFLQTQVEEAQPPPTPDQPRS